MMTATRFFLFSCTASLFAALAGFAPAAPAAPADNLNGAQELKLKLMPSAGPLTWDVTSLDAVGCNANETKFTVAISGTTGAEYWNTKVTAAGKRYMNETVAWPASDGSWPWRLYDKDTGGPVTASFPLPPDTPITIDFEYVMTAGASVPVVFHRQVVLDKCNGGTIQSDTRMLEWDALSLVSVGCAAESTQFTARVSGYQGTEVWRTLVDAGGNRYMDQEFAGPLGDGNWDWFLFDDNSGGPTTASFPLPPDTPITVHFAMIDGAGGPILYSRKLVLDKCNGGSIVSDTVRPEWHVHSLDSVGCNANDIAFTTSLTGFEGGPEYMRTTVDAAGLRYMDESFAVWGGNQTYYWSLYDNNSGGPVGANFPLPPDTPIEVGFHLIQGAFGPDVFLSKVTLDKCNGGSIVSNQEASMRDDRIFADGLDDTPPLIP